MQIPFSPFVQIFVLQGLSPTWAGAERVTQLIKKGVISEEQVWCSWRVPRESREAA